MASTARVTQEFLEVLTANTGQARATHEFIQVLSNGIGKARITHEFIQVLSAADSKARCTQQFIEVLTTSGPQTFERSLNDTLTLTDAFDATSGALNDTLTFTETWTDDAVLNLAFSDTLSLADEVFNIKEGSISDTLTLTDDFTGFNVHTTPFFDTLVLTDDVTQNIIANRIVGDALDFDELMTRNITKLLDLNDTLTPTDTFTGVVAKVIEDTLVFSDTFAGDLVRVISDIVEFGSQVVPVLVATRAATDQVILFESISVQSVLRLEFSDTLVLTEETTGHAVHPLETDDLVLSDSITGVASTPIFDTLILTDVVSTIMVLNRSLADILTFGETISASLVSTRTVDDVVEFLETTIGIRVKTGAFGDTLTFTEDLHRDTISRTLEDTLVLSETLTEDKIGQRTIIEELIFTEQMTVQSVINPGWSDTVPFSEGFVVRTTSSAVDKFNEVIVSGVETPVWEGVISLRPQMVLQGKTRVIVLPPPEFNDFVAGQGRIAVQKSMTGRFRAYAKRTEREKLNLRLVIPKFKSDELYDFMLAEIDNEMNLIDWNGYLWKVRFLNDSVSFVESRRWVNCGNANEVTLELVGTRYA